MPCTSPPKKIKTRRLKLNILRAESEFQWNPRSRSRAVATRPLVYSMTLGQVIRGLVDWLGRPRVGSFSGENDQIIFIT